MKKEQYLAIYTSGGDYGADVCVFRESFHALLFIHVVDQTLFDQVLHLQIEGTFSYTKFRVRKGRFDFSREEYERWEMVTM